MVGIRSCVEWIESVIHANFTDILFKLGPPKFLVNSSSINSSKDLRFLGFKEIEL